MFDHHYVTLFSNVIWDPTSQSPQDVGSFKTRLNHPLLLNDGDTIGLHEYFITDSWYDLESTSKMKLRITGVLQSENPEPDKSLLDSVEQELSLLSTEINAGRYGVIRLLNTIKKRSDEMKAALDNRSRPTALQTFSLNLALGGKVLPDVVDFIPPSLRFNFNRNYVTMDAGTISIKNSDDTIVNHQCFWEFEEPLAHILGLEDCVDWSVVTNTSVNGRTVEGINPRLLVYCDAIDHHLVGDKSSKLLKIIPVPKESDFGTEFHREVKNVQYFKPAVKEIREIEIDIRSDSGDPIKFRFGRVVLILDIRRKHNNAIIL